MDFLSEWVIGEKQQSIRIINVVDECSRNDLWIEAAQICQAAGKQASHRDALANQQTLLLLQIPVPTDEATGYWEAVFRLWL